MLERKSHIRSIQPADQRCVFKLLEASPKIHKEKTVQWKRLGRRSQNH